MKQALILFSRSSLHGAHDPDALVALLAKAAQKQNRNISFEAAYYEDLIFCITPEKASITNTATGKDLSLYDFVYQRRWSDKPDQAHACAIYLKKHGVPFVDSECYETNSTSKLTQAWRFWEHGLPHPKTVFVGGPGARQWLLAHPDFLPFAFPMIVKASIGFGGSDNHLVEDVATLEKVLTTHSDRTFVIQERIPNDGDYRVLVGGNKVLLLFKRIAAPGKHTNNSSQGGRGELASLDDVPTPILQECLKAAKVLNRDFAGVDLVFHAETNAHYFFEVNRCPQVETGLFVTEKAAALADYIYGEVESRTRA